MASISPESATVLRGKSFELSINGIADGKVIKMEGVSREPEDSVEIIDGATNVVIKGKYFDSWEDQFTFVPAGESDKTASPNTVTYFSNLPESQNLFDLNQDMSDTKVRLYDIFVTYEDEQTVKKLTKTFVFTHIIEQDWEIIKDIMANYKYNGTGAT